MSIGEIITTPTGLAVVTAVLPQTITLGNQTLVQVVSQPLTGGPSTTVAPPPGLITGGGIPYRSLAAQAATAYVAYVEEQTQQQLVADAIKGAIAAQNDVLGLVGATNGGSGSGSGSDDSSTTSGSGSGGSEYIGGAAAYFSASQAYQAAQNLGDQTGPTINMFG